VLPLRADFPLVPHLNLLREAFPRSLCLYAGHPAELLLGWSPRKYVERIRARLARTATQNLHSEDQPLRLLGVGPDRPEPLSSRWATLSPPGPENDILSAVLLSPPSRTASSGTNPPRRTAAELAGTLPGRSGAVAGR
jgi:hypothetical protein